MEKQKRNTKTKQMVMSVLAESLTALCYDDFERKISGQMDKATIYRILQGFCDEGKIHKIFCENGKTYYALCRNCDNNHHNDNHLHFRCLLCETVLCLEAAIPVSSLPEGYDSLAVSCTVSGYCPNCSPLLDETPKN
jgi:Fe2+ or Zn2+ uptake regulation protein